MDKARFKQYYEANREDILIKRALKYKKDTAGKERIDKSGNNYFDCKCGKRVRKKNKTNHENTKVHKSYTEAVKPINFYPESKPFNPLGFRWD